MKKYSIKEVSEITHLSIPTLRYYDREGLLPCLERKESGYRVFSEIDLTMLEIIECFKKSGLQIKEMKCFIELIKQGDASLEARYNLFVERKEAVESQIAELEKMLKLINHKCWYYQTAIEAGTEAIHRGEFCWDSKEGETP